MTTKNTDDLLSMFTFTLTDGRRVTFEGLSEQRAFNRAYAAHGAAVAQFPGVSTPPCECSSKHALSVRCAGFLICRDCAGWIS